MKAIEVPFPLRDDPSTGARGTWSGSVLRNLRHYKWLFMGCVMLIMGVACAYLLGATRQYSSDVLLQVDQNKHSPFDAALTVAEALQPGGSPLAGEIDVLSSRAILTEAIKETHADVRVRVASYFPIFGRWYARRHDDPTALTEPVLGMSGFAWGGERLHISELNVPRYLENTKMKLAVLTGQRWSLKDDDGNEIASGSVGVPAHLQIKSDSGRLQNLDVSVESLHARPGVSFFVVKNSLPYFFNEIASVAMTAAESSRESSMIRLSYLDQDPQFAADFVNAVARSYVRQAIARKKEESQMNLRFLADQLDAVGKSLEHSEVALNAFRQKHKTLDLGTQTAALLQKSVDIETQKAQLDVQRAAALARFRTGTAGLVAIDQQQQALAKQSEATNAEILAVPGIERDYLRLQRDVQVNTAIYTGLLQNKEQIAVLGKSAVNNVQVIDWGFKAEESAKPKARIILPVAFGLSLLLGLLLVQCIVSIRNRVTGPEGLTSFDPSRVHIVGRLKARSGWLQRRHRLDDRRIAGVPFIATEPRSLTVSVLHGLADTIERTSAERKSNIAVFVSPEECDGVTEMLDSVGYLMSARGRRVLLVDWTHAGSRMLSDRRAVHASIQSILADADAFEAAVTHGVQPNVDVLSANSIHAQATSEAPLALEEKFGSGAPSASARYDNVIVGMSLLASADALSVARFAAAIYVVGRVYETGNDEIANTITRVAQVGADVTGVVLCK